MLNLIQHDDKKWYRSFDPFFAMLRRASRLRINIYRMNLKTLMINMDPKNQIDVKAIMMDFERSSFIDEIKDLYSQGLIEKDLYVLLSQSDLSNKLKIYQMQKTGFVYRIINKILRIFYKLLYKMLEPVLNSQEKINKKLVLEIIKLKIGRDTKKD